MADKNLTALTAATTFAASDLLMGKVGANSRKISGTVLAAFLATATLAAGTLTVSSPFTLTQTWNDAGVTFTAFDLNVTATASAAASLLMNLRVGATSRFAVNKSGSVTMGDGSETSTLGTLYFNINRGINNPFFVGYRISSTDLLLFGATNNSATGFSSVGLQFLSGSSLSWNSSANWAAATPDLFLYRDAANIFAQRNGTAAQTFRIYNTYTDGSNYERGFARWASNVFEFGNEIAGTGVARLWKLTSNGSTYLESDASSNLIVQRPLLFGTDNSRDIGASGASRPRTGYFGTGLRSPLLQFGGAAATNAALAETTVTGGWGLNLRSGANTNGQFIGFEQVTEETTIAAAATTDTAIQIPANAIVLGVSVRVTTIIPTAANFTVIGTTSSTAFQTGTNVLVAAGTTDAGTKNCPYLNATAQTIRITPDLTPGDNTGRVRVTIHYIKVTPPTS